MVFAVTVMCAGWLVDVRLQGLDGRYIDLPTCV